MMRRQVIKEAERPFRPHQRHRRVVRATLLYLASIPLVLLSHDGASAEDANETTLAIVGATVFPSPNSPPLDNATVVATGREIVAVGPAATTPVPEGAKSVDARSLFLTAAFQNSHVHFTEAKWAGAATLPEPRLEEQLREMFSQYGFTTVVDAASHRENTLALRARIESGEVVGPRILTAGAALYPENGIPYYLKDSLPPEELAHLRTPATGAEARRLTQENADAGADALKLFAVSWMGQGKTQPMSPEVAVEAAKVAHANGQLVFAHPSTTLGLEIALEAGVDVLVHAVEDRRGWKPGLTERMVADGMALVPTLILFDRDRFLWEILDGVGAFAHAGGAVLFGTDAGYLPVYDPRDEYLWMAAAGLRPMEVLASLTTAPAERWGEGGQRGRVEPGMDADLVLLGADPRYSVLALTQVHSTYRAGRLLFQGEVPR